jgi:hypothetical protein
MDLIGKTNCIQHPHGEDKRLVRVNGYEKTIEWHCEETIFQIFLLNCPLNSFEQPKVKAHA